MSSSEGAPVLREPFPGATSRVGAIMLTDGRAVRFGELNPWTVYRPTFHSDPALGVRDPSDIVLISDSAVDFLCRAQPTSPPSHSESGPRAACWQATYCTPTEVLAVAYFANDIIERLPDITHARDNNGEPICESRPVFCPSAGHPAQGGSN